MQGPWIYSSVLLPHAGEAIEFKLEQREQPICGTFAADAFHSRWAEYGRSHVGSWRRLDDAPSSLSINASPSKTGSFARFFERLKPMAPGRHGNDLPRPSRDHPETPAIAAATRRQVLVDSSVHLTRFR